MKSGWPALSALLAGALASCVTININFPARQVERAAEVIVEEARGGEDGSAMPVPSAGGGSGEPALPGTPPAPPPGPSRPVEGPREPLPLPPAPPPAERPDQSAPGTRAQARLPHMAGALLVSLALLQEAKGEAGDSDSKDIKINIDTPVIRGIRQSLRKRFPRLRPFYESGAVGESRQGYLDLREEEKLTLAEKRDLKALRDEENRDRRNLYQAIVEANRFGAERFKDVERIFAREWIEKSRPGWWIQDEKGKWIRKPAPKKDGKEGKEEKEPAEAR